MITMSITLRRRWWVKPLVRVMTAAAAIGLFRASDLEWLADFIGRHGFIIGTEAV